MKKIKRKYFESLCKGELDEKNSFGEDKHKNKRWCCNLEYLGKVRSHE